MELHISLVGRKDIGREIYRQLRRAIADGRIRPGEVLPPSRELARRLSVSRTTVTLAYDRLAGEGFVTSRVGAGTFVNDQASRRVQAPEPPPAGGALRARSIWDKIPESRPFERRAEFDFRTGLPDASLFPHDRWRRMTARELRSDPVATGIYGHPAGHRGLREAIVRHIAISRGVAASADDVTITAGTQQALDIITRVLVAPGERIAMEDPGYNPPRWLFRSLGALVQGVPVDDAGLVVSELPDDARMVYVTPSHQYPLGVAMSLPRRLELLAWAERNDAAIVEDDYDSEFRFGGRPIEPLQTLDTSGRVIYVGSFSKTMLPTLRLGFLVTPPSIRRAVHRAKFVTDWHTSLLAQAVLARFIDEGAFARHIRKLDGVYRTRRELIASIIGRDFAGRLELLPSAAGLHVAALAPGSTGEEIAEVVNRAMAAGVAIQSLERCTIDVPLRPGIMLGYGVIPAARIAEGLRRLRDCFEG